MEFGILLKLKFEISRRSFHTFGKKEYALQGRSFQVPRGLMAQCQALHSSSLSPCSEMKRWSSDSESEHVDNVEALYCMRPPVHTDRQPFTAPWQCTVEPPDDPTARGTKAEPEQIRGEQKDT